MIDLHPASPLDDADDLYLSLLAFVKMRLPDAYRGSALLPPVLQESVGWLLPEVAGASEVEPPTRGPRRRCSDAPRQPAALLPSAEDYQLHTREE